MEQHIPPQPPKSYRVVLDLEKSEKRLDSILLNALRTQKDNLNIKILMIQFFRVNYYFYHIARYYTFLIEINNTNNLNFINGLITYFQ